MSAVLGLPADLLSTNERFVLLAIGNHANREGENARPSRTTICDETGLSPATVTRATNKLRDMGLLEVLEWPGRNRRGQFTGTVTYAVRLPGLKTHASPVPPTVAPGSQTRDGPPAGNQIDTRAETQIETRVEPRSRDQTGSQTGSHREPVSVEPWNLEGESRLKRCPKCDKPMSLEKLDDGPLVVMCVRCETTKGHQTELAI
jgi:DNA-binding transcriptional ArsR family regulator